MLPLSTSNLHNPNHDLIVLQIKIKRFGTLATTKVIGRAWYMCIRSYKFEVAGIATASLFW